MTCANVQKSHPKQYGKLPSNMTEEKPWNKLCVDLIVPHKICRKGKDTLVLKSVTIIYPVTGWFEVTQYRKKK